MLVHYGSRMNEALYEVLLDAMAFLGSAIGTVVFTAGGIAVERAGIENLAIGSLGIGAWEVYMGTLLLFVGLYLCGYRRLFHRLYLAGQS